MAGLKILILEDDEMISEILSDIVESMGHSVVGVAESETKGVALAARTGPDFLICDVTLEEGTGLGAARTICAKGAIPHIFASGDIARVKAAEPDAIVLEKPFRQADVAAAIARALAAFA